MKRLLIVLLVLMSASFGQTYAGRQKVIFTSTGAGSGVNLTSSGIAWQQITWSVTNGTLSACSVQVDSSLDGITWNSGDVIAGQTCTTTGQSSLVNKINNYIRIRVTTLTGGAVLTVVWTGYLNNPTAGSPPTGTGFVHITGGVQDGVATTDLSTVTALPASTTLSDSSNLPRLNAASNHFTGDMQVDGTGQFGAGIPNDGTTGTANKLLAKLVGSTLIKCAITDTAIPCYPVISGGGTTGNAYIGTSGTVLCTFDGAVTAEHWVQASTGTAAQCHDTGSATAPTSGWVIGRVHSTGAAGDYLVEMVQGYNATAASTGAGKVFGSSGNCNWASSKEFGVAWTHEGCLASPSATVRIPSGPAGTISNVCFRADTTLAASTSITITLMSDGVDTSTTNIVISDASGTSTVCDTTHSYTWATGHVLSFVGTVSGNPGVLGLLFSYDVKNQ